MSHDPPQSPSKPIASSDTAENSSLSSSPPSTKDETRCAQCQRRVGLLGFRCKCTRVFCAPHRYSDQHDCSYDHRGAARLALERANPRVQADKLPDRI